MIDAGSRIASFTLEASFVQLPPTPNDRINRWERARRTREVIEYVQMLAANELRKWNRAEKIAPMKLCDVEILVVVPHGRRIDHDNLVAATKPMTDALVRAGVMVDDSIDVIRSFNLRAIRKPGAGEYRIKYVISERVEL